MVRTIFFPDLKSYEFILITTGFFILHTCYLSTFSFDGDVINVNTWGAKRVTKGAGGERKMIERG